MTDAREAIIDRIHQVIGNVAGLETIARNRIEFDDLQLPAAAVLEGDEELHVDEVAPKQPAGRPYIVRATPQVYIAVTAGGNVGTELNALRAAVIKALIADTTLAAMTHRGYGIRYMGLSSQLHAGRSMVGAHALVFQLSYVLVPAEL